MLYFQYVTKTFHLSAPAVTPGHILVSTFKKKKEKKNPPLL